MALVLMFIIVEGQAGLRTYIMKQRQGTYIRIRDQILEWMKTTQPLAFDENVKFIYGDDAQGEVLQHLKVIGSSEKLMKLYNYPSKVKEVVQIYSKQVHFEITRYPSELLYGIHIEIDDYETSQKLGQALSDLLNLGKQTQDLQVNNTLPKNPGWVFITRAVELSGDIDKDTPKVMTHARHFVELVCHNYDYVYSKEMIDYYLDIQVQGKNSI